MTFYAILDDRHRELISSRGRVLYSPEREQMAFTFALQAMDEPLMMVELPEPPNPGITIDEYRIENGWV